MANATIYSVVGEPDDLEIVPIMSRGSVAKTLLRFAKRPDLSRWDSGPRAVGRHVRGVSKRALHSPCQVPGSMVIHQENPA